MLNLVQKVNYWINKNTKTLFKDPNVRENMLKIDQKYPQKYINIKKYLNATHKEEAHQLILFE